MRHILIHSLQYLLYLIIPTVKINTNFQTETRSSIGNRLENKKISNTNYHGNKLRKFIKTNIIC